MRLADPRETATSEPAGDVSHSLTFSFWYMAMKKSNTWGGETAPEPWEMLYQK